MSVGGLSLLLKNWPVLRSPIHPPIHIPAAGTVCVCISHFFPPSTLQAGRAARAPALQSIGGFVDSDWARLRKLKALAYLKVQQDFVSSPESWGGLHRLVQQPQFKSLTVEVTQFWPPSAVLDDDPDSHPEETQFTKAGAEAFCKAMERSLKSSAHPGVHHVSVGLSKNYEAPCSGKTMQLQVKTLESTTWTLDLQATATVADALAAYAKKVWRHRHPLCTRGHTA